MTNDRDDPLDHLTFSQRHGYEPIPEAMKLEEISCDLRREIWNTVRELLLNIKSKQVNAYFPDTAARFIERVVGKYQKIRQSNVRTEYSDVFHTFENDCFSLKFNKLLEMLEVIINDTELDDDFAEKIRILFEMHGAAYWLDTSRLPYRFIPSTSKEQGEATRQAFETVEQSGIAPGATTHLRKAVEHLNAGRYADSVSDSMHAVESVARVIDPRANKTLGSALDSLETAGLLNHPALKSAFKTLYGYTSDEQGIRHALLERDAADVGLDEGMFMFGACASFAAYLVNRHQKANGVGREKWNEHPKPPSPAAA